MSVDIAGAFSTKKFLRVYTVLAVLDILVKSAFPTQTLCPGVWPRPPLPQGGNGLEMAEKKAKPLISYLLRPIAFYPLLVDVCDGSVNAALMLSQILYWTPRASDESQGWFYKTQAQWYEELRLTRTQQDNAREILRDKGFIEEQLRHCAHGTVKHFRLKIERVEVELWALVELCSGDRDGYLKAVVKNQQDRAVVAGKQQGDCRKPANGYAGNLQRNKEAETTTETTQETTNLSLTPFEAKEKIPSKFSLFQKAVMVFYDRRWGQECPWDGSEAKQLTLLMKSAPRLDLETFCQWLKNYGESKDISPGERPRMFLPRLSKYSVTALNQFGRSVDVEDEKRVSAGRRTDDALARVFGKLPPQDISPIVSSARRNGSSSLERVGELLQLPGD